MFHFKKRWILGFYSTCPVARPACASPADFAWWLVPCGLVPECARKTPVVPRGLFVCTRMMAASEGTTAGEEPRSQETQLLFCGKRTLLGIYVYFLSGHGNILPFISFARLHWFRVGRHACERDRIPFPHKFSLGINKIVFLFMSCL